MVARAGPPCWSLVTLHADTVGRLEKPPRGWLVRVGRTCSLLQMGQMQLPLQGKVSCGLGVI